MLIIFWDSRGPVLETYLEHGTSVTNATYCDMLQRGLNPAVRSKRREGKCQNVPVLRFAQLQWEVMEAAALSPDLTSSDFHRFEQLEEVPGRSRFPCDEGGNNGANQWLHAQPKTFCYDGIKKLVERWGKCVEKKGDHIEK
jgi:hypothetical protein